MRINICNELTRLVLPKKLPFWAAVGMGVLSVMGNNQAQKDADKQAAAEARALGVKTAGIDFAAERTANTLMSKLAFVKDKEVVSLNQIAKDQARAESDAKVSAATSGVAGQSVDAVVNETERTAEEAKGSINDAVKQQGLQIQTDYVDNFLNAEISKGNAEFTNASSGERTTNAALGFAQGFLGGL